MLYENKHLYFLHIIKHRHDDNKYKGFDYENKLLYRLLSSVLFNNKILKEYLLFIQKLITIQIESVLVIRNFWNYTVDKYYNKHNN